PPPDYSPPSLHAALPICSNLHTFLGRRTMMEAGAATVIAWSIDAVRKGGNVVLIGVYGPPWNLVPIGTAMNKNLTLRMAQCNVKDRKSTRLNSSHVKSSY